MGTKQYRIPALSFISLRELSAEIDALKNMQGMPPAQILTVSKIVLAAMQRNYPALTMDELDGMRDIGNLRPALDAALGNLA